MLGLRVVGLFEGTELTKTLDLVAIIKIIFLIQLAELFPIV